MSNKIARRDVFQRLAAVSVAVIAPSALLACSKHPNCTDTGGLSADDLKVRNETAQYQDQTSDASKHCSICSLYVAPTQEGCGSCKVVKGPINPNGYCKLFVAKTPS